MSLELFMPDAMALSELHSLPVASGDFLSQVASGKRGPASSAGVDPVDTCQPSSSDAHNLTALHVVASSCSNTVKSADGALALLDELDKRHKDISARASLLHSEAKRLVEDEERMKTMAQRIYSPLTYFESLYIIGRRLGMKFPEDQMEESIHVLQGMQRLNVGPTEGRTDSLPRGTGQQAWNPHRARILDLPLSPEDEDFPAALDRIEECISWLAGHLQYRDAKEYIAKYRELQEKAVDLVMAKLKAGVDRVAASAAADIRAAQAAVAAAMAGPNPDPRAVQQALANSDAVEISALQLRWRTELSSLRPLLALIEGRAGTKRVYLDAAKRSYETYLTARLTAVTPAVRGRLERVVAEKTKPLREPRKPKATPTKPGTPSSVLQAESGAGSLSSGASVHSAYTAGTAATRDTRGTLLYGEEVTSRESCVVDAVRTCAALLARIVSGEHALFQAIFTNAAGGSGGAGRCGASGSSVVVATGAEGAQRSGGRNIRSGASVAGSEHTSVSRYTSLTRGTAVGSSAGYGAGLSVGGLPAAVRTAADSALSDMCDELCTVLTDALRPCILALNSLDSLVDVVTVIRDEVIREVAAPRGPALAPLARAATALLSDVRERLAFRGSGFIADYLDRRVPKRDTVTYPLVVTLPLAAGQQPADAVCSPTAIVVRGELDYPARLLAFYLRQRTAVEAAAATRAAMEGGRPGSAVTLPDPALTVPPSLYDAWLPVLEDTLLLIAKLHSALERPAFEVLAREAVQACARAVLEAGASVRAAAAKHAGPHEAIDTYARSRLEGLGDLPPTAHLTLGLPSACVRLQDPAEPTDSPTTTAHLDGCLLVVRSLLTLREQLSPYDMDPVMTQTSLDFTPTGRALSDIVSGVIDRSIFSLSAVNPLLGLFSTGLPSVSEQKVDVKAHLEAGLRAAAEEAVTISTTLLTRHLSAVLAKHQGQAVAGQGSLAGGQTPGPATPVASPGPVVLTPEQSAQLAQELELALGRAQAAFTALLPALRRRYGLYLGSPTTASVLWKPVRDRAAHVIIAARALVSEVFGGEAGVEAVQPTQAVGVSAEGATTTEAAGTPEASSVPTGPKTRLDSMLSGLLSELEASNSLITDPTHIDFGMDGRSR